MDNSLLAVRDINHKYIVVDDLRQLARDVLSMPALKVMGLYINGNRKSGVKRFRAMMEKDADWLDKHPQYKNVSWDFNFDETKHLDGFYYHFTQCPFNNFARKGGYLEVLPVMCDIDRRTQNVQAEDIEPKITNKTKAVLS